MKNEQFIGFLIAAVAILILISPVAAWNPVVTKTCPNEVCSNCPMECTVHVIFAKESFAYEGKVVDLLPAGAKNPSTSGADGNGCVPGGDSFICTWGPISVPSTGLVIDRTVTFTPPVGIFKNHANAVVRYIGTSSWGWPSNEAYSADVTAAACSPEFPSVYLPATFIAGILGAVLFIQRTKEH